jgi:hypothetical protein
MRQEIRTEERVGIVKLAPLGERYVPAHVRLVKASNAKTNGVHMSRSMNCFDAGSYLAAC